MKVSEIPRLPTEKVLSAEEKMSDLKEYPQKLITECRIVFCDRLLNAGFREVTCGARPLRTAILTL